MNTTQVLLQVDLNINLLIIEWIQELKPTKAG